MANLKITYLDLRSTATFLDTHRTSMTQTLVSLQNKVTSLTGAGFVTDKASKQFGESYKTLNDGIKQAVAGLEGMVEFLRSTADAYEGADKELAAAIRG